LIQTPVYQALRTAKNARYVAMYSHSVQEPKDRGMPAMGKKLTAKQMEARYEALNEASEHLHLGLDQ
jgi:hypothetical protein